MKSMRKLLILSFLIGPLALHGCASSRPVPSLLAIAADTSKTPPVVEGPELTACLDDASAAREGRSEVRANYSPSATYFLAERMYKGSARVKPFADRIRAYTAKIPVENIFGRGERRVVCYYSFEGQQLRYLTNIGSIDDKASIQKINDAILISYAKMAGKNVTATRLLGTW